MRREQSVPRAQLYRELWAEPALVLAKRYGVSDVGLAKVCRRYGIPKPGLGYWAQREVGKAPPPPPLPPAESAALETVFFQCGYGVSINEKSETIVKVLEEDFQIALYKLQKQVKVEQPYGTGTDVEPSGRLRLRIGPDYSSSGIADDPPRLIEDLLNRFIAGLVRRAVDAKRERALHEERERRWRVHDDERRLRDQVRLSDELRRRRLRVLAGRWMQHRRLSEFVSSVDSRILETALEGESRDAATRWVEWAMFAMIVVIGTGGGVDHPASTE